MGDVTDNVDQGFPPAGFLSRDQAAARLGVNPRTLREWVADGSLPYAGLLVLAPNSRQVRVYELAALDAAREQMRTAVEARASLPEGFVDRAEAARILGIAPDTLALWHTTGRLRSTTFAKTAAGKRCKLYAVADLEGLKERMAADRASRETPPPGFIDVDGVCEMLGITRAAWVIWKRQGKAPRGTKWRSASATYLKIYAPDEVRQFMETLRGPDRVFRLGGRSGAYHIPDGWVQLREAAAMFGVDPNTFIRWEREGLITCGRNETARRIKIYPRAELERLLAENGRYAAPYPDPERPGCWRVPLAGHDMLRREAIIDAEDLPLVQGRRFHFSGEPGLEHQGKVATFNAEGDTALRHMILGAMGSDLCVAHRNGDPLDCTRGNLVVRTLSEKGGAMRKVRFFRGQRPSSRFKGVCWDKSREMWVAYIKYEKVSRSLGRFHDELAAAQAYDEAAVQFFGEHARLNFPNGVDASLEAADVPGVSELPEVQPSNEAYRAAA